MTPYPAYKPTGLPWFPQIPEHWDIIRAKQIFAPIDIRSQSGEEQLLSVSERHGVVKREDANVTMFQAASYEGYKLCWPDDLAINSLWAWSFGLGFSPYHGIISTAYSVFRLKDKTKCLPRFYDYFVRGKDFHWELRVRSKGLWKSRYQLSDDAFLAAPMPSIPIDEQVQIVRYLDSMTAKINKLIRAKKKQIALLQEQKQAIINQAVTKGLNPDAEMKDSGVWCIVKTPAHWQKIPVKGIAKFINGFAFASDSFIINYTFPVVRIGDICDNGDINFNCHFGVEDDNKLDDFIIKEGDILIAMSGATTGKVGIARGVPNKSFINQRVGIIRSANCQYLYYCLSNHVFQEYVTMLSAGSAQPNLSGEDIKNYQIMYPTQSEISEITTYLDKKCTAIDAAISKHRAVVSTLQEYKNSLISAAVTGQIDVRNIPVDDFDPADLVPETEDDQEEDTINESEE